MLRLNLVNRGRVLKMKIQNNREGFFGVNENADVFVLKVKILILTFLGSSNVHAATVKNSINIPDLFFGVSWLALWIFIVSFYFDNIKGVYGKYMEQRYNKKED